KLCSADVHECFGAFFFFLAEDGIRVDLVTGVQTCALPIWRTAHDACIMCCSPEGAGCRASSFPARRSPGGPDPASASPPPPLARSEERRVGKAGGPCSATMRKIAVSSRVSVTWHLT